MEHLIEKLCEGADSDQRLAITRDLPEAGVLLVLAGPGSGKTSVLTRRLLYLILRGVEPSSLLALTFTEAAAAEMKMRVGRMLEDFGLNLSLPKISTFHSLGLQIILDSVDGVPNWKRLGYPQKPDVLPGEFSEEPGGVSFSDMITQATDLLENHAETKRYYREKYTHLLVDEFQDTSPDQLKLAGFFSAKRFFVGDDDQAIYGFRGTGDNLDRVLKKYPQTLIQKLQINYRSTPRIVRYANSLFRKKSPSIRKHLVSANLSRKKIFLDNLLVRTRIHRTSLLEASWMAEEMKRLKNKYELDWGQMAVLYRVNSQRNYYRDALAHFLDKDAAEGISFQTLHKSKGLEYPVVFLVGLENSILPYFEMGTKLSSSAMAEEKRLFYVGITRAEGLLYLCACRKKLIRGKFKYFKTSSFLLESGSLWQRTNARLKSMMIR